MRRRLNPSVDEETYYWLKRKAREAGFKQPGRYLSVYLRDARMREEALMEVVSRIAENKGKQVQDGSRSQQ